MFQHYALSSYDLTCALLKDLAHWRCDLFRRAFEAAASLRIRNSGARVPQTEPLPPPRPNTHVRMSEAPLASDASRCRPP